jgi:hypothetical protein
MANLRTTKTGRRATRLASTVGLPWVSELHLEAYLEAREALRRARAAASSRGQPKSPPLNSAS